MCELDMLALVARGRSNRGLANELRIAEEPANSYLSNVLQKHPASDFTHAVGCALRKVTLDQ
jgi:two-component system response regulator DegU